MSVRLVWEAMKCQFVYTHSLLALGHGALCSYAMK